MQKLSEPLPTSAEYRGKRYKIRPTFGRVMTCMDICTDETLSSMERVNLCLGILLRRKWRLFFLNRRHRAALFEAVFKTVIEKPAKKSTRKDFDFVQDARYIYAAFWQAYGIDLFAQRDRLHWWAFMSLLGSLPDNTRFSQIVQIRTKPMPKPTKYNAKERLQLARLKQEYGLKKTEEERKADLQQGLASLARRMEAIARRK